MVWSHLDYKKDILMQPIFCHKFLDFAQKLCGAADGFSSVFVGGSFDIRSVVRTSNSFGCLQNEILYHK